MATAAEKLRKLIQELPENELIEVLNFAESLRYHKLAKTMQPGALTGLQGIAVFPNQVSDEELYEDYVGYLARKYQ